jgi:Ca2+-transporting ATPase
MLHPPRPRHQPLLDKSVMVRAVWLGLLEAALCFAGFLGIFVLAGFSDRIGLPYFSRLVIPDALKLSLTATQAVILASTVYHAGVVTAQAGNALACRSDHIRSSYLGWLSNSYLLGGIFIELFGIVCIIYIPFLAGIFKHMALPGWMWIVLGSYALIIYSVEWIRKTVLRRFNRRVVADL